MAFGALRLRCIPFISVIGPTQSWGATGKWFAAAIADILFASDIPPTQHISNIHMSTAFFSKSSLKLHLKDIVSLAVTGMWVNFLKSASASRLSIGIGSSYHKGSIGSKAFAILFAEGKFHIECSSTIISIFLPTASLIFWNGSTPLSISLDEINSPFVLPANWSNGQIFIADTPSSRRLFANSPASVMNACWSSYFWSGI